MTVDEFRAIALGFPEAEESSHMDHPDFRVSGKIFATLGPDLTWGMAKLTPDQQAEFIAMSPAIFRPSAGAWGRGGATQITLADAASEIVHEAIGVAYENICSKRRK